jgi:dolichol kinase
LVIDGATVLHRRQLNRRIELFFEGNKFRHSILNGVHDANKCFELKTKFMKQVLQSLVAKDETHEKFHLGTTIFMILLFLTFWGVSFYVLVNSLA